MDASEEQDLWVQRNSSDLLEELLECIPRFLYRKGTPARPRKGLSGAALSHVIRLLEMFQEWPQLLDPSLEKLIAPINNAFLVALQGTRGQYATLHERQEGKLCLPQAICTIFYTLCKVRGAKVIVRFLSNEARYLEPILEAFEVWSVTPVSPETAPIVWEERYILLLWLSHLTLTPFDLSTVASSNQDNTIAIQGLILPTGLPSVSVRLLTVATTNLSSASKERESATLVLVRLALRPDMQRFGLHRSLIEWAVSQLEALQKHHKEAGYLFIGLLSFLAAMIKLSDKVLIAPFLLHIFNSVEQLGILQSGSSSALTRKATIKIYSACSVAAISLEEQPDERLHLAGQILETVIEDLLSCLGDNDTPVRQSASKSLSVIAVKLDPSMAADISEAVIASLEENVLWETLRPLRTNGSESLVGQRNLTLVSASKWQGLTLTLAQLLFRRCPPVSQLPAILNSLILALSFEQRSSTGASSGTNVRDAACFGIWAIARRYTTAELLSTNTSSILAAAERGSSGSVLQLLALELLVTATVDPAGNIRRGASAALQELIGRHPDTIAHGIPLVQVVDYHAVALRSRAMKEVATNAAKLDNRYWQAILRELTTWRGIGAADVESRRLAAETLGILSEFHGVASLQIVTKSLWQSLGALDGGTVQKRQGFLLGLASIVRHANNLPVVDHDKARDLFAEFWKIFASDGFVTDDDLQSYTARPELLNEATATLIHELCLACADGRAPPPGEDVLTNCFRYLSFALERRETAVLQLATEANKALLVLGSNNERDTWIASAFQKIDSQQAGSAGITPGFLLALGSVYSSQVIKSSVKAQILQKIVQTAASNTDIDTRVVALQALTMVVSGQAQDIPLEDIVLNTIDAALHDYTTDQRGDVGSLLRLEAILAVSAAFERGSLQLTTNAAVLLQSVCILAGEKLDKVRSRAWACLETCWSISGEPEESAILPPFRPTTAGHKRHDEDSVADSPHTYFSTLLRLNAYSKLQVPLIQGISVSIGGGSETVLVAARLALSEWLYSQDEPALARFADVIVTILQTFLADDRVLTPALETLAFVLDTNTYGQDRSHLLPWKRLFILVQKAHFKSANVAKLLAAIDIYGSIGLISSLHLDVLKKLSSLLVHPFPKIRAAAADSLFVLTQEGSLRPTDWSDSTKFNKQALAIVKESIGVS